MKVASRSFACIPATALLATLVACADASSSTTEILASIASRETVDSGAALVCTAGTPASAVARVPMEFRVLGRGEGAPAMTGGTPDGYWTIDKVTLLLPSIAGPFVRLSRSSGHVTGWAEFSGDQHRVQVQGEVNIAILFGSPIVQTQNIDTAGTFTVADTSVVNLTPNCAGSATNGFDVVSFSTSGDRGTIIAMVETTYGDSWLVLEGPKN